MEMSQNGVGSELMALINQARSPQGLQQRPRDEPRGLLFCVVVKDMGKEPYFPVQVLKTVDICVERNTAKQPVLLKPSRVWDSDLTQPELYLCDAHCGVRPVDNGDEYVFQFLSDQSVLDVARSKRLCLSDETGSLEELELDYPIKVDPAELKWQERSGSAGRIQLACDRPTAFIAPGKGSEVWCIDVWDATLQRVEGWTPALLTLIEEVALAPPSGLGAIRSAWIQAGLEELVPAPPAPMEPPKPKAADIVPRRIAGVEVVLKNVFALEKGRSAIKLQAQPRVIYEGGPEVAGLQLGVLKRVSERWRDTKAERELVRKLHAAEHGQSRLTSVAGMPLHEFKPKHWDTIVQALLSATVAGIRVTTRVAKDCKYGPEEVHPGFQYAQPAEVQPALSEAAQIEKLTAERQQRIERGRQSTLVVSVDRNAYGKLTPRLGLELDGTVHDLRGQKSIEQLMEQVRTSPTAAQDKGEGKLQEQDGQEGQGAPGGPQDLLDPAWNDGLEITLEDGQTLLLSAQRIRDVTNYIWELASHWGREIALEGSAALALRQVEQLAATRVQWSEEARRGLPFGDRAPQADLTRLPQAVRDRIHGYQGEGVQWMYERACAGLGGLVGDYMGMGKTLMTLCFLAVRRADPGRHGAALVCVGPSTLVSWINEIRDSGIGLDYAVIDTAGMSSEISSLCAAKDLVLCTHSAAVDCQYALKDQRWSDLVVDEAHDIRNPRTLVYHALAGIRAQSRFALSATPLQNNLEDLWALFELAVPGLLGALAEFKRNLRRPIEEFGSAERIDALRARIEPFVLMRLPEDVRDVVPQWSVEHQTRYYDMGDEQRRLYEAVRATTVLQVREVIDRHGLARSRGMVLQALLHLRQICSLPEMCKLPSAQGVPSAKYEGCLQLVRENLAEGRRIVVCTPFTAVFERMERDLNRMGVSTAIITGRVRAREEQRQKLVSGQAQVMLLGLKSGGQALNLQAADTFILYDGWWNPFAELQASARVDRQGQTGHVRLYDLRHRDGIEDRMEIIKVKKRNLFEAVFGRSKGRRASTVLTREDIDRILAPMPLQTAPA